MENENVANELVGKPFIEAHAAWLNSKNIKANVWIKATKARIYIKVPGQKRGVDAFFDYEDDGVGLEDALEIYDGSLPISFGSRLRVYGKTRGQGAWWFNEIKSRLLPLYPEASYN